MKCRDFCKEMVNAAKVDSNVEVAAAIWNIVRSCTWDPLVLESFGSMRPYGSQLILLVKLMECESCRKLLSQVQLRRCRRQARVHSQVAVSLILSRCALKYPEQSIQRILSIVRSKPPCDLTRFDLENFYSFIRVNMVNIALPDPFDMLFALRTLLML